MIRETSSICTTSAVSRSTWRLSMRQLLADGDASRSAPLGDRALGRNQVIDEQRQRRERRPQLVRRDGQELIARRDRLAAILEQALAFLGDAAQPGLGVGRAGGWCSSGLRAARAGRAAPGSCPGSGSATTLSSVIVHRPAPISARCIRMRSVGLLPPHSTPDLLDRLGARRRERSR